VVFGFFKKKEAEPEDDDDIEPVSFLGPTNGQEVNLKAHAKLVEAGLVRAKDLVTDALAQRADGLKIEPKGQLNTVTIYIDGIPQSGGRLSKAEGLAVTQVMKLVAGLDPKQRTASQSGGIKAEFESKKYVLMVSSTPVPDGERLMIRINDQAIKLENPAELGMGEEMRLKLKSLTNSPGVVLVTGPPGSGVTTTMYGVLRNVDAYIHNVFTMIDSGGRTLFHVSTYDDPVQGEDLEGSLTRLARREANCVLVEPIRSAEVAKPVFAKADSLMIISEMTAKDTASAVQALVQQVGDPALVAEHLRAIVQPKLLRRLCQACRLAYRPKPDFLKKLGLPETLKTLYRVPPIPEDAKDHEPCPKCSDVGYLGRVAMFEMLEVTPAIKEIIAAGADPAALRAQMKKEKATTLQADGLRLVAEGVTALEELQRVFKPA
jgi:type II secretory ATPase GspE/PulE/Tfp pilus assembly ATPase PilB-like protein